MSNLTLRFAQTVGRHFVTLSCRQVPRPDEPSSVLIFSGFIIAVAGEWFFVTAGHILRGIRRATDAGSSFSVWRLGDETAGNQFKGMAVPYDFRIDDWLVVEDPEVGLDYAAVHLSDYYRRQLEAGGVMAIDRSAWSDHATEFDHWALIGIPSESVDYDGERVITARVVVCPLVPAEEPGLAGRRAENQFYAKPIDGSESYFADADGFSGGPVFALKHQDGRWMYAVIGIQSAWYPSNRTLAICPFSSFGLALESLVNQVHADVGRSASPKT